MSRATGGRPCYISAAGIRGVVSQLLVSLDCWGTCFSGLTELRRFCNAAIIVADY